MNGFHLPNPARRSPPRRPSKREEGATLIVMVLLAMIILAGLIVVTANVSISGIRATGDQRGIMQAQYAADSGVSLIRSRLTTFNALVKSVSIPPTVIQATMELEVANLCGIAPALLSLPGGSNYNTLDSGGNIFPVRGIRPTPPTTVDKDHPDPRLKGKLVCAPNFTSSTNFGIFNDYIPQATYSQYGLDNTSEENAYWYRMFAGSAAPAESIGNATIQFSLLPIAVTRTEFDAYRLYFLMSDAVQSVGQVPGAQRVVGLKNQPDLYYIEFARPSFAKYALFTNHHYSTASDESAGNPLWFTGSTQFSGPVHTNQNFNFFGKGAGTPGSGVQPWFGGLGNIESAGCPAGQISTVTDASGTHDTCLGTPSYGARFYSASQTAIQSLTSSAFADPNHPKSGTDAPDIDNQPNWKADFVDLPNNGSNQALAAQGYTRDALGNYTVLSPNSGGLYLPAGVYSLDLKVGTDSGVKYQYISYALTSATPSTQLRYAANGVMQIYDDRTPPNPPVGWVNAQFTGGVWKYPAVPTAANLVAPDPHIFNGVVYAAGAITSLQGPARSPASASTSTASNTAPSIASFAQLTIAASGTIGIASDLEYENRPCTSGTAYSATCTMNDSSGNFIKNILGIYSSGGDVQILNDKSTTPSDLNAPNNVNIDAVMMASGPLGAVRVQNYNAGSSRGNLNLQGGLIENYYGASGTFNPSTGLQSTGFGRNYVYDPRMSTGYAPPSFPTQRQWTTTVKNTANVVTSTTLTGEWQQEKAGQTLVGP